jgi:hypothetical protein
MNFGEWRAKIYQPPGIIGYQLWLFSTAGKTQCYLNSKGEQKEMKEGATPDLNGYFAYFPDDASLMAIADALASHGVKTTNDHKNEGLLIAKDAHLQDMRRLVFKDVTEATEVGPSLDYQANTKPVVS